MKLKDKVAIITGGGRGIGEAYSRRFADEGAKVVVADILLENAQKVAKEIEAKGGQALALRTDVSDIPSTLEMAEKTIARFGGIDILLNNAALYGGFGVKRWDAWAIEDWERSYKVNVIGSWLCIKAAAPSMIARGKGKIINIGSGTFDLGLFPMAPYTCSKAAVVGLTRTMARALGRYNINVNCLSPGYVLSDASKEMPGTKAEFADLAIQGRCFRRHEYPEDMVGTAVFLASPDSDFITGQTIRVEGGEIMV